MSHIVKISTQLKDRAAVTAACSRLGLAPPTLGEWQISGATLNGLGVRLPGWIYPIVIAEDGSISFDNYNGNWGHAGHLDAFRQMYAVEKAKIEARKKGHTATEVKTADGSIRLEITLRS